MRSNERITNRTARLIALTEAVAAGEFDPQTVNMSELAEALGVYPSTIMRDLEAIEAIQATVAGYRVSIRKASPNNSYRL